MSEKKSVMLKARSTPEEMDAFRAACETVGVKESAVIRDLCAAAIPYMAEHCPPGRWIAPSLVPYGASHSAEVTQIHNGKGHQVAKVKKTRK